MKLRHIPLTTKHAFVVASWGKREIRASVHVHTARYMAHIQLDDGLGGDGSTISCSSSGFYIRPIGLNSEEPANPLHVFARTLSGNELSGDDKHYYFL